jgi:hypothetical protein
MPERPFNADPIPATPIGELPYPSGEERVHSIALLLPPDPITSRPSCRRLVLDRLRPESGQHPQLIVSQVLNRADRLPARDCLDPWRVRRCVQRPHEGRRLGIIEDAHEAECNSAPPYDLRVFCVINGLTH